MNKKFTTFLASAMLVSAFSVGSVAAYVGAVAPAEDVVTSTTPATVEGKDLAKDQTVLFMSGSDFLAAGMIRLILVSLLQFQVLLLPLNWQT